ncbi:hypothetical protein [Streptococcus uberis]|uniref:hypothetical protein n=1 Tax=Streptococcus uberis TaxID=1349 RepID=UPI001939FDD5|nr:hypothetical protein [Streptococcus uberis]
MVNSKNTSQRLKKKEQKLKEALEKIKSQKNNLIQKEKEISKNLTEVQSDLIIALLSETGKSFEELENYAKSESEAYVSSSEDGDVAHVQNN